MQTQDQQAWVMETDSGNLQNLHDIVTPAAVSWWPLAPGWYVIAGLVLLTIAGVAWRSWRRYLASGYRRDALHACAAIELRIGDPALRWSCLADLAELLKRVALAAYPREQVAGLTGDAWWRFLETGAGRIGFDNEMRAIMDQALYGNSNAAAPNDDIVASICSAARDWIGRHDPAPRAGELE